MRAGSRAGASGSDPRDPSGATRSSTCSTWTFSHGTSSELSARSITHGVRPPLTATVKRPRAFTAARASAAMISAAWRATESASASTSSFMTLRSRRHRRRGHDGGRVPARRLACRTRARCGHRRSRRSARARRPERSTRSGGWRRGRRRCRRGSTRGTECNRASAGPFWNFSVPPNTGRRPASSRRKMRCRRSEISFADLEERHQPAGACRTFHAEGVAVVGMELEQRANEEDVHREPHRAAPVGVPAEHPAVRLGRLIGDPVFLPAHSHDVGMLLVPPRHRADAVGAQELLLRRACVRGSAATGRDRRAPQSSGRRNSCAPDRSGGYRQGAPECGRSASASDSPTRGTRSRCHGSMTVVAQSGNSPTSERTLRRAALPSGRRRTS